MNKYQEAYKLASNLTPRDMLDKKVRKAVDLVKEACDKADKYDEKETPKKPIRIAIHGLIEYECPNECEGKKKWSFVSKYQNYCPNCGQKLDWSD